MLFRIPPTDAADDRVIDEINSFRQRLRHQLAEPRRWEGQLRRSLTAGAVRGSNTIEGYTVSEDEAEALVAGEELSAEVDSDTLAAVAGYRDALTYVQQSAHFDVFHYDEMLFSALHFMMTRHHLDKWPGRYRRSEIYVTGGAGNPPVYTGPQPDEVPSLMRELVQWLNSPDQGESVWVSAAMAHLNLVSIHPWRDGNGRMSRCLHTLLLARDRVLAPEFSSIEEWLGLSTHNTMQYYEALERTRRTYTPTADAHPWAKFCLRAHHLQAQIVDRRFDIARRLWTAMDELASRHNLPERTVSALYAAATGHLRRTIYQHDEGLSRDRAIRDLQALRRTGLIEADGKTRGKKYYPSKEIASTARQLREEIYETPLIDPYKPRA